MRITLKEPGLTLEVNKVDTPTGTGWCIIMPNDRKVLVKFYQGKWETAEHISMQFLQSIGNEINRLLEADQPEKPSISYPGSNHRPKRARILKYFLI
jgi:hypothetical protein